MAILSSADSLLKRSFLYYIVTARHHRFELILWSISLVLTSLQIFPSHTDYVTAFADRTGKCSQPSANTVARKPNVSISNSFRRKGAFTQLPTNNKTEEMVFLLQTVKAHCHLWAAASISTCWKTEPESC